jgi:Tol biopolymer transport system component
VKRENANDSNASQSAEALISNIYIVNVETGEIEQVTHLAEGRAETPHWSPDGNTLAFQSVLNGRMDLQVVGVVSEEIKPILAEPACCPGWMRK